MHLVGMCSAYEALVKGCSVFSARAADEHAAAVRAERFKAQEAARQAAEARARESRPQTRAARAKVLREKRENKREGVLH